MNLTDNLININGMIENEKKKIRKKYLDSAEEIVSGYNKECELSKDYEGRQMFELLQNADDAAVGCFGKVRVVFDGKRLSVSNTGTPFGFRGVKSLLYPYASPKKIHADKIGCKGLGFRSILTWAESVTVASENFTIQFSREYAKKFLQSILEEKTTLKEEIKALTNEEFPIATLTCPKVCAENALEKGYSTSIIVECREDLVDAIENQIVSLRFEELAFLPNLKEIEIICKNYHKVFCKVAEKNEVIVETKDLIKQTAESAGWKLYKKTGEIKDENGKDKTYEFIIAYDPSGRRKGSVLYSYFKTDVSLGFPALIHGTFELTSDRNSLQKQSKINKQLVRLLADFMVQTALDISKEQKECDYKPLGLVISSDMDIVLKDEYELDKLLKANVYEKNILPTIENKYISIKDQPKYAKELFSNILKPDHFPELLKTTDDQFIADYLKSDLDIRFYEYEELCNRLNAQTDHYSLEEKVELIFLIKEKYIFSSSKVFPHLLVDVNQESISDDSKVYPLPTEDQVISLPAWVNIKFLNQKEENLLLNKFKVQGKRRELVSILSKYNMEEYSFDRLLRSVVKQCDAFAESVDKCLDVLNWLWHYYISGNKQPISDVNVKVICRDGSVRYAKECYMGAEYGNELGERIIRVYSQNFISLSDLKINCGNVNEIIGFLEWLGVAKYPKIVEKKLLAEEQKQFLKTCYPLYVPEDHYTYTETEFFNINEVIVGSVEHLEQIIERANFNDLLAWFVLDADINQRIKSDTEEKNSFAHITGKPAYKQQSRKVSHCFIKSYLHYYLSVKEWIPDKDGNKKKPAFCCFEDNALAPFIIVPMIDYGYIKQVVGRNCRKEIEDLLNRLGIADVFQEMKNTVVYQALMKLPELDPECKFGKSLYRKIIKEGLTAEEYKKDNPDYEAFIKKGFVLAKQNGTKKYVPVSAARYADKKIFSGDILRHFNMLDVDARSGEEKIKQIFGVQPLKNDSSVETEGQPELHPLNEDFKKEYLHFLPFVAACRSGLKNENADFRRLKSTKVILCSNIAIRYKIESETRISTLKEYETIYLREENIAYICLSKEYAQLETLKQDFEFADSVAELITAILDVNEDKDFFRDLFRDPDSIREKKMRVDKGDDNLDLLANARIKFAQSSHPRDEFWMTLADITHFTNVNNSSSADDLIAAMRLPANIDDGVDFENLNSAAHIQIFSEIFSKLDIDLMQYNAVSNYPLNASSYWMNQLKEKMRRYKSQYQSFLMDRLKNNKDAPILYDDYIEKYNYPPFTINNSLFVNIDEIFSKEYGVSFNDLNRYSENTVYSVIQRKKEKIDKRILENLQSRYPSEIIDIFLLFDRVNELIDLPEDVVVGSNENKDTLNLDIQQMLNDVLSSPRQGFSIVETQSGKEGFTKIKPIVQRKCQHKVHSEPSVRKKEMIGIIGEACVYKELKQLYQDVKWVSGNAQKVNQNFNGDDTCGYDMKYIDENGTVQYVEVKASTNENIKFFISDNELRFGCRNASNYEIIYVVIGEDGKPAHRPWRLGHIFEFKQGEDLFCNKRFFIESDSYKVVLNPGIIAFLNSNEKESS